MLFMKADAVLLDQGEEILGRVARQRALAEMRIIGQEILRAAAKIREIASAAAGDQDLLSRCVGTLNNSDAGAEPARFRGAQESGRAGAQYQNVKFRLTTHGLPNLCNLLG